MIEVLAVVAAVAVGFYAGFKFNERIMAQVMRELLDRAGVSEADMRAMMQDLQQDLPEDHEDSLPRVSVRVEVNGDQLFVYREDTQEFLGQGRDRETVLAAVAERFRRDFVLVITDTAGADLLKTP